MTGVDDRELGTLISQYREHRDTLRRLSASAPDTRLAERYEKLVEALSVTIERLLEMQHAEQTSSDDLEVLATPLIDRGPVSTDDVQTPLGADEDLPEDTDERPFEEDGSGSWDRPFVRDFSDGTDVGESQGSRMPLILILLVGLPLLAVVIWMQATGQPESSRGESEEPAVESPVVEEAPQQLITVSPASHDFGEVRRGTRSSHEFAVRNDTEQTVNITIDRSNCRCLWYDVPESGLEPGATGRLVVTVDGSRASGALAETVVVRGGSNFSATIDIDAVIR